MKHSASTVGLGIWRNLVYNFLIHHILMLYRQQLLQSFGLHNQNSRVSGPYGFSLTEAHMVTIRKKLFSVTVHKYQNGFKLKRSLPSFSSRTFPYKWQMLFKNVWLYPLLEVSRAVQMNSQNMVTRHNWTLPQLYIPQSRSWLGPGQGVGLRQFTLQKKKQVRTVPASDSGGCCILCFFAWNILIQMH